MNERAALRVVTVVLWLSLLSIGWVACSELVGPLGARTPPRAARVPGPEAEAADPPEERELRGSELRGSPAAFAVAPVSERLSLSVRPPPDYEQADLDAENDLVVAPPAPLAACEDRLTQAGIKFKPSALPFRKEKSTREGRAEVVACGAEQVVLYLGGPAMIRYNTPPTLTCRLALALARFELLAQEEAERQLGQRVARFKHLGTYSCRKMVRFDFVSEHSYANAIDIAELTLENGDTLSVKKSFGSLTQPPETRQAVFLRSLAQRAFDERLFSTVLTPFWDELHSDHFHLDLARYRVDGTRG